jgi:3-oxoacyl-[acyl-carrier protein] reductase
MSEPKIAIVTGATRGIGQAISLALKSSGIKVIGTATTKKGVEDINAAGFIGALLNLTESNSVETFWSEIKEQYQTINILVNNAGITRDNLLLRMKEEEWHEVLNVHLTGAYRMCKMASKYMIKNKWGRIVNISSTSASLGNAGQANYSAAKAGLEALTRTMAREFGSRNITSNVVAPGFISTDMTSYLTEEERLDLLRQIPLERFGKPDEVAELVNYLISEEASYITGQTIHLNGGLYM